MIVATTIADCRKRRASLVGRVALVPTMGALHQGHLSLIELAKQRADNVVVSIFVNPTQFGPREDFNRYPRPIESDLAQCKEAGIAMVFNPSAEEMYRPDTPAMSIEIPQLSDVLEGKHRPGHFSGVCQVVAKLFNIVEPHVAVFGQKDFQQLRIIKAMTEGLNWPIEIIGAPTVREDDGIAMSSRNANLSKDEHKRSLAISRALNQAKEELATGVKQTNRLIATMRNVVLDVGKLGRVPVSVDYVAAVDPVTLKNVESIDGPTVLAIAARVGNTRLIDNMIVEPPTELPPKKKDDDDE
ncbi:MAG: pantoate--beta-alanine ligase [Anaerolineae bacterium]|nr:pantoate--beta-alanine ligase [Phycisphaerae bacterium]